jgi:DnaJ-domain-containing protein 1
MLTHRFGRKIKLPATIAIKHQIRKLMLEEAIDRAEAAARAEEFREPLRQETRSLVHSD